MPWSDRFEGYHRAYLKKFSQTRHMIRDPEKAAALKDPLRLAVQLPIGPAGIYYVGGKAWSTCEVGEGDDSVLQDDAPPGFPGRYCKWEPTPKGDAIRWNGIEKFEEYVKWLEALIAHFLQPWGYVLSGSVGWQGDNPLDFGVLTVNANIVYPNVDRHILTVSTDSEVVEVTGLFFNTLLADYITCEERQAYMTYAFAIAQLVVQFDNADASNIEVPVPEGVSLVHTVVPRRLLESFRTPTRSKKLQKGKVALAISIANMVVEANEQ
jgi:hypothetical protein